MAPALGACANCDDVILLFVFDDHFLRAREFGSPGVTFMIFSLDEVDDTLAGFHIGTGYPSSIGHRRRTREEYVALGKLQGTK